MSKRKSACLFGVAVQLACKLPGQTVLSAKSWWPLIRPPAGVSFCQRCSLFSCSSHIMYLALHFIKLKSRQTALKLHFLSCRSASLKQQCLTPFLITLSNMFLMFFLSCSCWKASLTHIMCFTCQGNDCLFFLEGLWKNISTGLID